LSAADGALTRAGNYNRCEAGFPSVPESCEACKSDGNTKFVKCDHKAETICIVYTNTLACKECEETMPSCTGKVKRYTDELCLENEEILTDDCLRTYPNASFISCDGICP
jgi:hypothetical protein